MFKPNTLFVVGAGASREAGLPLGDELVVHVARLLSTIKRDEVVGGLPQHDPFIRALMNFAGPEKTRKYEKAAAQMIVGMRSARSVDRFIDRNRGDEFIRTLGKAAIVQTIAQEELGSHLSSDHGGPIPDTSAIDSTWYFDFANMLLEGSPPLETLFKDIAIVCFNYDRCIEHYLTCELMRSYYLDRDPAAKLVKDLIIWHPYGTIASLDSQEVNGIAYGDVEAFTPRCFQLADRIKTFTEEYEDEKMLNAIRARLQTIDTVVFLGFSYYQQNLTLIAPDGPTRIKRILGTGHGLSESDRSVVIGERLQPWHKSAPHQAHIQVVPMKCSRLLNEYRLELTV